MLPHVPSDLRHFRFASDQTLAMFERSRYMIDQIDPEIFAAIQKENQRQEDHIESITSENYTSPVAMVVQGSQLINKYAEGYPGKRHYGGCEYVDVVEQLTTNRVKQLFGAEAANMQPNSGSQANQSAFFAVLKLDDTVMGTSLVKDGHLTHGMAFNMSGKWFDVASYGLNAQEDIDYGVLETLAQGKKPKLIIAGASAFALCIDFKRIGKTAKSIGAYFIVGTAHYVGLIAAGMYPNPVSYADFVMTTTYKSPRGLRGGVTLTKAEHEKAINSAIFPGIQGGPLMHVIAGKVVAFEETLSLEFKAYQQQVVENAAAMAETLMARNLRIVFGRTKSHVMLIDLRVKKITGKEAEEVPGDVHITVNRNAIPNDPERPFVTSGMRLGSPAMTTCGFKEAEAVKVAHLIADVLDNLHDEANIAAVRVKVAELIRQFPVYG